MAGLALPGIATGIDTATLVQQLMAINSRRLANYRVSKLDYDDESDALKKLKRTITSVKASTTTLSDMDNLVIFSTSSSDTDILTVGASSDANPGSHTIEINQLAAAETWIQQTSTFSYKTDYVGGGIFIYSYNNQETSITAVDKETTLQDFVNLINKDPNNPGVTASLLYQSGEYHLMLSGQETGEDYHLSVNSSSTEVWQADSEFTLKTDNTLNAGLTTKITELYQFGASALEGGETIEITGTDRYGHAITQLDLTITSNTTLAHLNDAIENAFDGNVKATLEGGKIVVTDTASGTSLLTVVLAYNANGSAATLTMPTMAVSKEGAATVANLASFASSTFIKTQSAQNSKIKVNGYPSAAAISEIQTMTPTPAPSTPGETYTLTYKGQTTTAINYDATYAEIQTKLEELSTVNTNDIVVTGSVTDGLADGDVVFTFSDSLGDVSMILIDDSGLASSTVAVAETAKGVSDYINKNSNSITDAISGVTLNLKDVTPGADPIEITITRNITAIASRVQTMIDAHNSLKTLLKDYTEYNATTKKMGILSANIGISFMKTEMSNSFFGLIDGFVATNDTLTQASDIGITVDGAGMLEFDIDVFTEAIDENYTNVLEIIGATKDDSGNSSSDTIDFYGASDKYTTAGTYLVEVDINGSNEIDTVRIKMYGESSWRENATWTGEGYITFDSSFNSDSDKPVYSENSLQITIDLNKTVASQTYTTTIRVKQGIAGALEDLFDEAIEVDGRLDTSIDILDDKITTMESRIERETARLKIVQDRLIQKFARMEKILIQLQQQMNAANMLSVVTFGS